MQQISPRWLTREQLRQATFSRFEQKKIDQKGDEKYQSSVNDTFKENDPTCFLYWKQRSEEGRSAHVQLAFGCSLSF